MRPPQRPELASASERNSGMPLPITPSCLFVSLPDFPAMEPPSSESGGSRFLSVPCSALSGEFLPHLLKNMLTAGRASTVENSELLVVQFVVGDEEMFDLLPQRVCNFSERGQVLMIPRFRSNGN